MDRIRREHSAEIDNQPIEPLNKLLWNYLDFCHLIAVVAIEETIVRKLKDGVDIPVWDFKEVSDFDESVLKPGVSCIFVNADVFDEYASSRISEIKELTKDHSSTFIFATTSFMPGAYRELVMMSGADDCFLETKLSKSLLERK